LVAATTKHANAELATSHPLVAATTKHANAELATSHPLVTATTKHANAEPGTSHPLRGIASNVRHTVRSVVEKTSERSHRAASK
jgi:CHAD domain-containing protein